MVVSLQNEVYAVFRKDRRELFSQSDYVRVERVASCGIRSFVEHNYRPFGVLVFRVLFKVFDKPRRLFFAQFVVFKVVRVEYDKMRVVIVVRIIRSRILHVRVRRQCHYFA